MEINGNNSMPKNAKHFICEKCTFTCSKESNWHKHLLTRKHKKSYKKRTYKKYSRK